MIMGKEGGRGTEYGVSGRGWRVKKGFYEGQGWEVGVIIKKIENERC